MKKQLLKISAFLKLQSVLAVSAILLTGSLSGCELLPGEGGCGFGNDVKPDILYCGTEVTVTTVACGSGAFQNRWLQLANGEYLQPFENQTYITDLEPGKRYFIGYDEMRRDNRYDGQVACLAMPPKAQAIRLLCITPVDAPDTRCDTYATATNVICGAGAWANIWLKLDDGKYLQPWHNGTSLQQIKDGTRYKIGYNLMAKDNRYNNAVICQAMPADPMAWQPEVVSINCIEEVATQPINTGK